MNYFCASFLVLAVTNARRSGQPLTLPAFRRSSNLVSPKGINDLSSPSSFLEQGRRSTHDQIQLVSGKMKLAENLVRGAVLRIASDLSGGTPLESIKCRVTTTKFSTLEAYHSIVDTGGLGALWDGSASRAVEGALMGALFLVGSSSTKKQVVKMGGGPTLSALFGGMVGGVAQAFVMTPCGLVFTTLNVNQNKPGMENDNAFKVMKRIVDEKGFLGLYAGMNPMCLRQATNWASRSAFTEIARTQLKMSKYGLLGEIGSGVIGGLGSCWNTPIETARVFGHRDIAEGKEPKTFVGYLEQIKEEDGVPGLFRGVTPRGIQAIWQTVFMVAVPNILGV